MNQDMTSIVANASNEAVLRYIGTLSAHDGVAEALLEAVVPLGDVQAYCPDSSKFRYVVVATKGVVFGLAAGMDQVGFRLSASFVGRALATGGNHLAKVDPNWVHFDPFQVDMPKVDLEFWARKAYVFAREDKVPR